MRGKARKDKKMENKGKRIEEEGIDRREKWRREKGEKREKE